VQGRGLADIASSVFRIPLIGPPGGTRLAQASAPVASAVAWDIRAVPMGPRGSMPRLLRCSHTLA
jgi:hypothetical protein